MRIHIHIIIMINNSLHTSNGNENSMIIVNQTYQFEKYHFYAHKHVVLCLWKLNYYLKK
jgi:hypothetical protein